MPKVKKNSRNNNDDLISGVNWKKPINRYKFLDRLSNNLSQDESLCPNIREILSPTQIEVLLKDAMDYWDKQENSVQRERFLKFVISSGYTDQIQRNKDDPPLTLQRHTALLQAVNKKHHDCVSLLFKIYDRFDVNYTMEIDGYSHFHAACQYGCDDVVKQFLEKKHDPNLLGKKQDQEKIIVNRPLHYALDYEHSRGDCDYRKKEAMEQLLDHGANPNEANAEGSTPLHIICKTIDEDDILSSFFESIDKNELHVHVDALDNEGRTPLQVAISCFKPDAVEYLLEKRTADPSKIDYPYTCNWDSMSVDDESYFLAVASSLAIVEILIKNGYKMNQSDAEKFEKDFKNFKLQNFAENWYECEDFRIKAQQIMVKADLSLYRLIQLPYDEAKELLTYMEFWEFARLDKLDQLPRKYRKTCALALIKTMTRRLFERLDTNDS
uniref:Uncharacterized protein n=1 Tax=Trichogramma kaykai TaxID=54128 RepID=A0ABD2XIA0_9HYME